MTHASMGNEVTPKGIVHRCSCGWVSPPCFSNLIASVQGQEHREAAGRLLDGVEHNGFPEAPHAG
jgi:hypothetical protein